MKIAIIDELHDLKRSGVYYSTEDLKKMFNSHGIDCQIIGLKKRGKLFNKLVCLPYIREFLFLPVWNRFMVSQLTKEGYDIVFYQCTTALFMTKKTPFKKVFYTRALLSRRLSIYVKLKLDVRTKLIIRLLYPFIHFAESVSFKRADRIIASKQKFADYLVGEFGLDSEIFWVIPQMISLEPRTFKKNQPRYDLICNTRLSVPKGWPIIEELAKIGKYKIVAVSPELTNPPSIPRNIEVRNRIPNTELDKLMAESRIFIMPSYNEEGPRVTLEAMACGLPVVASEEGSGEFMKDGVNGFIIKSDNPKDYVEAIDKLLSNKPLMAKISKLNPPVAKQYRPEVLGPKYIQALKF